MNKLMKFENPIRVILAILALAILVGLTRPVPAQRQITVTDLLAMAEELDMVRVTGQIMAWPHAVYFNIVIGWTVVDAAPLAVVIPYHPPYREITLSKSAFMVTCRPFSDGWWVCPSNGIQ